MMIIVFYSVKCVPYLALNQCELILQIRKYGANQVDLEHLHAQVSLYYRKRGSASYIVRQ